MVGRLYKETPPLCACGCGKKVNKYTAKYLQGHHRKVNNGKTNREKTPQEKTIQEKVSKLRGRTHGPLERAAIVNSQNLIQYARLVRLISRKAEQY